MLPGLSALVPQNPLILLAILLALVPALRKLGLPFKTC